MKLLTTGQFFGMTNQSLQLGGLNLTDTEYTHPKVDWHYHENAYFTFILQGRVLEGNRKERYHCTAGDLLFHHWQEPHYNLKPKGFTRGFHVELKPEWVAEYDLAAGLPEGSIRFRHPAVKLLMYRIFAATKAKGTLAAAEVDSLLLDLFATASGKAGTSTRTVPQWVHLLEEFLQEDPDSHLLSLSQLARQADVHPVHLSRAFPAYFQCTLGDYLRLLKVQRASGLLADPNHSLAAIAADCGFADQSHFIRTFRRHQHTTPYAFRKLLGGC